MRRTRRQEAQDVEHNEGWSWPFSYRDHERIADIRGLTAFADYWCVERIKGRIPVYIGAGVTSDDRPAFAEPIDIKPHPSVHRRPH